MEPALAHSERDVESLNALRAALRADTDQSTEAAEISQKLGERLTRYFQSIPEQRKQVKDLIGVVMTTLRTASRGSDDFAERLSGFSSQVEKAENPEDILAVKEAILKESRALSIDIATMKEQFESVNDTVRKAHAQIAKLQNELVKTKSLSLIDPLTAVPNRRGFDDWVERVLRTSDQGLVPFAFMVFDIDHFKRVNDTYGHMSGDQVLREVSARIVKTVRDGDFVSRFGGEEFCVALPGGSLKEGIRVAGRILDAIRGTPIDIGTSAITINASVGLSEHRDGETMEEIFERSDRALYLAKETGRDKVCTELDVEAGSASAAA
jgi:diguanylate cyclase (GGDEF)-like protein